MKRPLVWFTAAFICGVILHFHFSYGLMIVMLGAWIFTVFAYKNLVCLIFIPILLIGMLPATIYDYIYLKPISHFDGAESKLSCKIISTEPYDSYLYKYKYQVETNSFGRKSNGIIYSKEKYNVCDKVSFKCFVKSVYSMSHENSFDYRTYLINKGIDFTAYADSSKFMSKEKETIGDKIQNLRGKIISSISSYSSPKNRGFLSAILMNDKEYLSDYRNQTFRKTGISHLMAVSGFHVTVLLGFLYIILKTIRVKKVPKATLCSMFLILLIPFMGGSPSIIRAAIMGLMLLWSEIIPGDNDTVTSLSLAALIILIFRPYSLWDPAFILSFTSTGGIVLIAPCLKTLFMKYTGFELSTLSVVISAQMAIFLANIYYNGEISYISFFTNLIFVPVFPVLLILLLLTLAFGSFMPFLAVILNLITDVYIGAVEVLAKLPHLSSSASMPDIFLILFLACIPCYFIFNSRMKYLFGFLAVVFAVCVGMNIHSQMTMSKICFVSAGDMENMLIVTPENTVLIAGYDNKSPTPFDYNNLKSYLDKKGIKNIDIFHVINYNRNTEYLYHKIMSDYSPKVIKNGELSIADDLSISFNDKYISLDGDRRIAYFSAAFPSDKKSQIVGTIGKKELYTVFDAEKALSYDNKNIEIYFDAKGVDKMRMD